MSKPLMNVMMLCPLFCDWGYHGLYAGLRTGETAKHKCAIPSGGFRLAMPHLIAVGDFSRP